jgi:uncharacterized membrane protein SirB2
MPETAAFSGPGLALGLAPFYPALKTAHVTLVGASGALFMARGAAVLARQAWPLARCARWLSVAIDVALLGAGVGLWTLLQLHPLRDPWLGTKLALLLAYIVLGSLALKRGRTPSERALAYLAALLLYAGMAGVALAHHPLGWMRSLLT